VDLIRRAFLDTIGVALLGTRLESAAITARVGLEQTAGTGPSSVWGMGRKSDALTAALINGTSAHAELFDDNSAPMIAHPSAPLVSALLSLAQARRISGADAVVGYCAGFEVGVTLGRALNPRHYEAGWHATSVLGTLGGAAGCARLLGLDAVRTAHAIGIAVSMASGVRQAFGTMTMALHSGLCARNAVHAALLAEAGLMADERALDGRYGFFKLYAGEPPDALPTLGQPFELLSSGIIIKPFPTGAPTLAAIDAAVKVRPRVGSPETIDSVECLVHSWNAMTLREEPPTDSLKAKVNLRYCVAAALVFGKLTYRELTPACLKDPGILALMEKISIRTSRDLPDNGEFPAVVIVTRADGKQEVERCDVPPGGSTRPLSRAELVAKFESCSEGVLAPADMASVIAIVQRLEMLPDLGPLCEILEKDGAS
jgi:2-methylcitrate dehydratase PrpD